MSTNNPNLIDPLISYVNKQGFECKFNIDRLHIFFGAKSSEDKIVQLIEAHNLKNKIIERELPKRHSLNRMLTIFQPDIALLKKLHEIFDRDGYVYVINYIELALDCATDNSKDKSTLRKYFLRHLTHTKKDRHRVSRFYFKMANETCYSGKQSEPIKWVLYSDKPSKTISLAYCVHLEWRLIGSSILEKHNILTLDDVITFDHSRFWDEHLELRKLNAKILGQITTENRVSRQSLTKAGNKAFEKIKVLQEELANNPLLEKAFPRITTVDALSKILGAMFCIPGDRNNKAKIPMPKTKKRRV